MRTRNLRWSGARAPAPNPLLYTPPACCAPQYLEYPCFLICHDMEHTEGQGVCLAAGACCCCHHCVLLEGQLGIQQ
jgi:hypothetical protein